MAKPAEAAQLTPEQIAARNDLVIKNEGPVGGLQFFGKAAETIAVGFLDNGQQAFGHAGEKAETKNTNKH